MNLTRRKILAIIGGGTIVAATAGIGGFLSTRTPHKALEPWALAGNYAEPRKRALSYAILAPNPHNRQPWLVDLNTPDQITLYVDTSKMLPHTDPFNRQITIGLGCFLELLRMAAAEDGYLATINPFPDGENPKQLDKRAIAHITFSKNPTPIDPLFAHVLTRQSHKQPYDLTKKITKSALKNFISTTPSVQLGNTVKPTDIKTLRQLTRDAILIEMHTPRTHKESVGLFRIGKTEINQNPDGINLGGPMLDSLSALGMLSREAALDKKSSVYSQSIDTIMANVDSAMGYVWLTTNTNSRQEQLDAGREWIRTNLTATANGIAMQPMSQALQEYPEMAEKFTQLHNHLNAKGKVVQMLARIGYATPTAQSPRWPLETKII